MPRVAMVLLSGVRSSWWIWRRRRCICCVGCPGEAFANNVSNRRCRLSFELAPICDRGSRVGYTLGDRCDGDGAQRDGDRLDLRRLRGIIDSPTLSRVPDIHCGNSIVHMCTTQRPRRAVPAFSPTITVPPPPLTRTLPKSFRRRMLCNDSIGVSPNSRGTLHPLPLARRRNDLIKSIVVVRCDNGICSAAASYWHFSSLLLVMKRLSLDNPLEAGWLWSRQGEGRRTNRKIKNLKLHFKLKNQTFVSSAPRNTLAANETTP
jgi:hypothetical protein